jgi:vacuolar-type H+-ATPase subunit H
MVAFAYVQRRTVVALMSVATAVSCVSMYLRLSFLVSHYVNSNVSEAKLQFTTLPDQLPFEIQRLKEEASASQASEIEKTRQEVEQAVTTQMEKRFEEHLADLREKHKEEMEQLRTVLSKQMNDASSNSSKIMVVSEANEAMVSTSMVTDELVQQGDFIYRRGDWDGSPVVLEEYKLIFFTSAKVECTVWKQLFRRIMGKRD